FWALTGRRLIREAIARDRPDVVVATSPPVSAVFASAAAAEDVPLVADLRDLWAGHPYYDRGSPLLARLEGRALAKTAAVVTVTDGCRENLLRLHPELAQRLHVLTNGVNPALFAWAPARAVPPAGPRTLIFGGALYGDHTAEALVAALARPELRGRAHLDLVGFIDPRTRRALLADDVDATVHAPVSWEESIDRVLAADVAVVITTPETGGDMAL